MRAKIRAAAALLPPGCQAVQFDALGRTRAPFHLEPLTMEKPLYVVSVATAPPWVLVADPVSREEAERRIRWQVKAGVASNAYRICTYDAARDAFVSDDGAEYRPGRGPYTVAAWADYMAQIKARAQ